MVLWYLIIEAMQGGRSMGVPKTYSRKSILQFCDRLAHSAVMAYRAAHDGRLPVEDRDFHRARFYELEAVLADFVRHFGLEEMHPAFGCLLNGSDWVSVWRDHYDDWIV